MADVTASRNTKRKLSAFDMKFSLPVDAAAGTIYQGTMVGITSAGKAVKASAATCIKIAGVACKDVTYADANSVIEVDSGIFCFTAAPSTAAPALANGDRYAPCYVLYDGTVTNDAGAIFAGLVEDVDSDGVYVAISPFLAAP